MFLGDFGKKLIKNFQEIQIIAWTLLIFAWIVLLKQPDEMWEAQILYMETSLLFSQCGSLSVWWEYQLLICTTLSPCQNIPIVFGTFCSHDTLRSVFNSSKTNKQGKICCWPLCLSALSHSQSKRSLQSTVPLAKCRLHTSKILPGAINSLDQ